MNRYPMPREATKTLATTARHPVRVQDIVRVADGQGGYSEDWEDRAATVWASISPIRADQRSEYKTQNVYVTHRIRLRGYVDIVDTGENRIRWGGRQFRIHTVEDIQERGVVKVCTCEEIRSVGKAI